LVKLPATAYRSPDFLLPDRTTFGDADPMINSVRSERGRRAGGVSQDLSIPRGQPRLEGIDTVAYRSTEDEEVSFR
jgi:hypothetical protein